MFRAPGMNYSAGQECSSQPFNNKRRNYCLPLELCPRGSPGFWSETSNNQASYDIVVLFWTMSGSGGVRHNTLPHARLPHITSRTLMPWVSFETDVRIATLKFGCLCQTLVACSQRTNRFTHKRPGANNHWVDNPAPAIGACHGHPENAAG
ncbi:hypothetical protein LZ32DRAFT_75525 [Colletotrichum eremochloae]|nr:hypothetical protein LZ32DRAFT_75525 [Colletotrichum eremochloae]